MENDLTLVINAVNNASKVLTAVQSDLRKMTSSASAEAEKVASSLKKTAEQVKQELEKQANAMIGFGTKWSLAMTLPIAMVGKSMIKNAMDMEETQNKISVIFGDSAKSLEAWGNTTLKNFGLAKLSALDMAASFGDMGTSMGLSQDNAMNMSKTLTELAGDMASFKNVNIDIAKTALNAVYTGETESLKLLGIMIQETNLQEFARQQGIDKSIQKMTQQEKLQLRYAYVLDASKNSIGDFARTAESATNQTRTFGQQLVELSTNLGSFVLPAFNKIITALNQAVAWFGQLSPAIQQAVMAVGAMLAVVGPLTLAVGLAIKGFLLWKVAIGAIIPAITAVKVAIMAINPAVAIIAGAVALFAVAYKKNWLGIGDFTKSVIKGIKDFFSLSWGDMWEVVKTVIGGIADLWSAVSQDILANLLVAISKIGDMWSGLLTWISALDWGAVWGGMVDSAKKIFSDLGQALGEWAKSAYQAIKSILSGEDTKVLKLQIDVPKKAIQSDLRSILDQASTGEFSMEFSKKSLAKTSAEIGKIMQKSQTATLAKPDMARLDTGEEIKNALEAIKNGEGVASTGKAMEAVKNGTEDLTEELKKLSDQYQDTFSKANDEFTKNEQEFSDLTSKYEEEISSLKNKLYELKTAFDEAMGGFNKDISSKFIEQEAKIEKLRKEISEKQKDGEDTSALIEQLKKEEQAVTQFKSVYLTNADEILKKQNEIAEMEEKLGRMSKMSDYDQDRNAMKASIDEKKKALEVFAQESGSLALDISEAKKFAELTEFDQFLSRMEEKKNATKTAYEEEKAKVEQDVADREAEYSAKKAIFDKEKQAHAELVQSFANGNAQMVINALTTEEELVASYNRIKSTLDSLRAITAPKGEKDNRTDSQVFALSGASSAVSDSVFGAVSAKSNISNQKPSTTNNATTSINVNVGSVDSPKRVNDIRESLAKVLQKSKLKSS